MGRSATGLITQISSRPDHDKLLMQIALNFDFTSPMMLNNCEEGAIHGPKYFEL
jgi:hypothetical protein